MIQFSRELIYEWGLDIEELFKGVQGIDILEVYQYTNNKSLSKQRIVFTSEDIITGYLKTGL